MLRPNIKHTRLHMTALLLLLTSFLMPQPVAQAAPVLSPERPAADVGGPIAVDTTWTAANSPYIASSSVLVMENVTLTIEPGVTVKFDSGKSLQVSGTLLARGTAAKPIVFTSNQANPAPGDWGYVLFDEKSIDATFDEASVYASGSVLQYVTVEYAGQEENPAIRIEEASPWIDHSTIQNNLKMGIDATNSASRFTHNEILNNGDRGIRAWENDAGGNHPVNYTQVIVDGNHIANNRGNYIYHNGTGIGGGIWIEMECSSEHTQTNQVTNNVVEYNKTSGFGGGILFINHSNADVECGARLPIIQGNIIRHNIAAIAAGLYIAAGIGDFGGYAGHAVVADNQIYRNETSIPAKVGYGSYSGCAGIMAGLDVTVTHNLIIDNHAAARDSEGGGVCATHLFSNTIAGNYSAVTSGVWIYVYGGDYYEDSQVINNSIVHNIAETGKAGVYVRYAGNDPADILFRQNTLLGNVVEEASAPAWDTAICIRCDDHSGIQPYTHTIQFNNFWPGTTPFLLTNNNAQGAPNLNATNNWWGSSDTTSINDSIYDFFDESKYAIVDYANFLTAPNLDAPLAPPRNLQVTVSGSTFKLAWDANQEPDLAGYKVHYDDNTFPYAGSGAAEGPSGIDVGNVTSYSLSGLPTNKKHFFTVTAYDEDGNESWHSLEAVQFTGHPVLENGDFEAGPTGVWDEHKRNQIRMGSWADSVQAHSGDFYAILAETWGKTMISQQVHIDPETPLLRYYWMVQYTQPWYQSGREPCGSQGDGMFVYVDETQVGSHPPCTSTTSEGWQMQEIDLSSYAGQTVDLRFVNDNPNGYALLIDDVALVAKSGSSGSDNGSAQLAVDQNSLTFSYVEGAAAPSGQGVRITNAGTGSLQWTAQTSADWLVLNNAGGSAPATLVISVDPAALAPGLYQGTVTVTSEAEGSPKVIAVTLTVTEVDAESLLIVQPLTVELGDAAGTCTASGEAIDITSQGASLSWTASESTAWLTLAKTSGTTPDTLSLNCDASGMESGRYSGQIIVSAPGSTPQVVNVRLTVGDGGRRNAYLPLVTH